MASPETESPTGIAEGTENLDTSDDRDLAHFQAQSFLQHEIGEWLDADRSNLEQAMHWLDQIGTLQQEGAKTDSDADIHHLLGWRSPRGDRESGSVDDLGTSIEHLTPEETYQEEPLEALFANLYQRMENHIDVQALFQPPDTESVGLKEYLAVSSLNDYRRLGNLRDLEAAIQKSQQAADLTPEGDPNRAGRLQSVAISLIERYRRLGNPKDLESAVQKLQQAVDLTPEGHPDHAERLQYLAVSLQDRYQSLGDLDDLEAALQKLQLVLGLTPEGDPNRAARLQDLALSFRNRYQRLGDVNNLEAAIQREQEALVLISEGDPDRAGALQSVAISLIERHRRLGDLEDLESALNKLQQAVDLTPEEHPVHIERLEFLAASLQDRYQSLGDLDDLEAALQKLQLVLGLTPEGNPDHAARLQALAGLLTDRYQRLGDLKDLEASLQIKQEVLSLTPEGHPNRAQRLEGLAVSFTDRYRRLGDITDLEAGLQTKQEALSLTPEGHPAQADRLGSLGVSLLTRYRRLGDLQDLEGAWQKFQQALDLTPEGHPARADQLEYLATSLTDRYERLGDLKDLEAAVQRKQEAVDLGPERHIERAGQLRSLAMSLTHRYRRLGDLQDLETALQMNTKALSLTPQGHADRAYGLGALAGLLGYRYRRLGDLNDLEASMQKFQEAADLTPEGHLDQADQLHNLALCLKDRYGRKGDLKDLEVSLQKSQQAVNLTPEGHPTRAERLQALANIFIDRYERLRDLKDAQAVHTCYSESFKSPPSDPELSWSQALQWALFAEKTQSAFCIPAYQAAFAFLPDILWMGHSIPVRHDALHRLDISKATSRAVQTCINLSDLCSAVEFLEQGIATIFQQMLQLKTDVDFLPLEQAQTFRNLSSQLYNGTPPGPITVVEKRKKLLEEIRTQPGLEDFLLMKSYKDLCYASQGGPVVILSSHAVNCNAIIILNPTSEPVHLSLHNITRALLASQRDMLKDLLGRCNVRNRGESSSSRLFGRCEPLSSKSTEECFRDMLNWLWSEIVEPVYKVLESHGIINGRLWWLPTGGFTGLPLHASPPTDEFVHSYTATLGSLLDAYNKKPSSAAPKLAVIGVTHTDSYRSNPLKGVTEEVKKISIAAKDAQCLVGEKATVEAVKLQLQDCSWVHLACHGRQDLGEPTKSHLQLYEGTLELETILRMPLPNAQFVFLAACQTAMGDAKLVNESFHLGGGFITAGFRSAIGTMWSMHDSDGPTVAEIVYSHLFRDGQEPQVSDTAEALQLAVKELKKGSVPYERWIPFIHMGI